MSIRPNAEFLADFPDDQIEEDGDIVQFGGRAVAETLAEILKSGGYTRRRLSIRASEGWDIDVPVKSGRVWLEVTDLGDKFILQSVYSGSFWSLFRKRADDHATLILLLADGMGRDPRFRGVQWRWDWDMMSDKPGSARPDQ